MTDREIVLPPLPDELNADPRFKHDMIAPVRSYARAAVLADRAARAAAPDSVRLPTTADEAELMAKVGMMWLQQNAPERCASPPRSAEWVAEAMRLADAAIGRAVQVAYGSRPCNASEARAALEAWLKS